MSQMISYGSVEFHKHPDWWILLAEGSAASAPSAVSSSTLTLTRHPHLDLGFVSSEAAPSESLVGQSITGVV